MVSETLGRIASRLHLGTDLAKVLRAAGLVMLIQVLASALSYATQVLLARWLGPFQFGVYVFAWSWAVLLPIVASLGLSQATVRFVPQYLAQAEFGRLHGLLRLGSAFVLVVGGLVTAAGWLALTLLGSRVPEHYVAPVRLALLCVPWLGLISFLGESSRGLGRVVLAYVPAQLVRPGLFIVLVAVLSTRRALDATLVLELGVVISLVTALSLALWFRRTIPLRVRRAGPAYELRRWLRVALPLFFAEGIFAILWSVDTVMLGFMRQPNEVAVYDACMKTAGLTFFVFTAMSALAAPKFVELYYGGDRTALVSFVRSIARWTFWPSAAVVLGVVALGRIVLSFFGTSFVVGYPSLVLLAVGYLTFAITGPTNAYLTASGHQDDIVPAVATASILNIALNLVLIPRHGVLGASVASVISIVVARVWLYVAVRRRLGLDTLFYR